MKKSFRHQIWLALPVIVVFVVGVAVWISRSEFSGTFEHNAAKVADHLGYAIQTTHGYEGIEVSPNDPRPRLITVRGVVGSNAELDEIRGVVEGYGDNLLTSRIVFEVTVHEGGE